MNVGICIHHSSENMREQLANAVSNGFHHGQLISWVPANWTDESAAEISALCRELDFTITAFWCGWVGPKFWNFTEGPQTLGLVPVEYRHARLNNLLDSRRSSSSPARSRRKVRTFCSKPVRKRRSRFCACLRTWARATCL